MSRLKLVIATLALLLAVSAPANAATITFGVSSLDNLASAGAQLEAGFTYSVTGAGWELETTLANPGAALATFFNGQPSNVGAFFSLVQTGGGTFTFDGLQWATFGSNPADDVVVEGFLGAALVGSAALTGASTTFQNLGGFAGPIDQLKITVTQFSEGFAMAFDNILLNSPAAVPEPGTLLLLGAGLVLVARRLSART